MDALEYLRQCESDSVNCIITSPPYFGLRDYGVDGQIGLEGTLQEFIAKLVEVFREARRVLRGDGTFWLNMGDSYVGGGTHYGDNNPGINQSSIRQQFERTNTVQGMKSKNLMGQPWRLAFALQDDGWYLRSDIIWHKPNPMPESVTDRPTKSHEYVFLLTKSARYWYDAEAIRESLTPESKKKYANPNAFSTLTGYHEDNSDPKGGGYRGSGGLSGFDGTNRINSGRNKRTVWTVATKPMSAAHFATFPEALIKPMILAGCPKGGVVLDMFMGAGTTALVAQKNHRNFMGCELNPDYIEIANARLQGRVKEYLNAQKGLPVTAPMFGVE
jgi:DNA modification methylase